ncbi:MAG: PhoX family phosphatase, partial [Myxococcota bacterium]|nr:PhoX family phosphatase [Myxococcota bacterium]
MLPGSPEFRPDTLTASEQALQFGFNNDFVAYIPLDRRPDTRGLLCVNHEYTAARMAFPGVARSPRLGSDQAEHMSVEMAAHGHSVVEIQLEGDRWDLVADSPLNRRLDGASTPFLLTGPAAGHPRLKTAADPTGRSVLGTLHNCSGGVTPWGTVLLGEENIQYYFSGDTSGAPEARNHERYGLGSPRGYHWDRLDPRWDLAQSPHEPNRFGWIVELDPMDPSSTPRKRTALGRLKHEGAGCCLAPDGRVVLYMGDDASFEYLYRFVSRDPVQPGGTAANLDLLDHGTLSVARFDSDGTVEWLNLVHGQGPLTDLHGFHSQADVLIESRTAADLLGATPMDRPEGVVPNPKTGHVYVILTGNSARGTDKPTDAVHPRVDNRFGQILELSPPGSGGEGSAEHAARTFEWDILLIAGNPADPQHQAHYGSSGSEATGLDGADPASWFICPDNCTFDPWGRMWVATDGSWLEPPMADGLYALETEGPRRGAPRRLYLGPRGSEVSGPCFTPDGCTVFVSVQHPADEDGSTFDAPSTRWPDFDP